MADIQIIKEGQEVFTGEVAWPQDEHLIRVGSNEEPLEDGTSLVDHATKGPERLNLSGAVGGANGSGALETLRSISRARDLVEVVTPVGVYENMLIVKVAAPRSISRNTGLRFDITLQEVLTFELEPLAVGEETSVDPAVQRPAEVNRGRVESLLETVEDAADWAEQFAAENPELILAAEQYQRGEGLASLRTAITYGVNSGALPYIPSGLPRQLPPLVGRVLNQRMTTVLGDTAVSLGVKWNDTAKRFLMDARTDLGDAIANALPLETGVNLLAGDAKRVLPGVMAIERLRPGGEDTPIEWGSTHRLVYEP